MKTFNTFVVFNLCLLLSFSLEAQTLCSKSAPISCGSTVSGTTSGATPLVSNYECELTNFHGRERVYRFTPSQTTKVSILLSINKAGRDLDLFLIDQSSCVSLPTFTESSKSAVPCLASSTSTNVNSNRESIFAEVIQGTTYYIVVDSKLAAVADSFKLTLQCTENICDRRISLSCGESKIGEKITTSDLGTIRNYPGCSTQSFFGSEKIYQIDLVNDFSVQIGLHVDTTSKQDFDVFLVSVDECIEIKCLKQGITSAIKGSKYINMQLGQGTYYVIVDSKDYYANGTFSIDLTCSEISCSKTPALSCQSPSSGVTGTSRTNYVSIYKVRQSNGTELYYPGHTGGEKTYTFEVYETQLVKLNLSQPAGSKLRDLNLFLLKSCNRLDGVAASVRRGTSIESISMVLAPGVYYVVVDDFLNAEGAFTLSIEFAQPCANVCMFAGSFISRGTTYFNQLSTSEVAPVLLYNEQCVRDAFGGNLTRKKLYTDIFVFYNEVEGTQILLRLNTTSNAQNLRGFIMTCSSTQTTTCLGSTQNGLLDLGPRPAGFYYVVIVGTQTMPYSFDIIPTGACEADPAPIPINVTVSGDVTGGGNNYSIGGINNPYVGCYSGGRTYSGEDVELQFTLETSSNVEILLTSSNGMGVFLYGATCGKGCLAYAETSANGGSGLISDFPLNAGTYYLIVDKSTDAGGGQFTVKISTRIVANDMLSTGKVDTVNCATSQRFEHVVNLVKPTTDADYYTATDLITFYYGTATGIVKSKQSFWDVNKALQKMVFRLKMDSIGVQPKCGYEEGENILIYMTRNSVGQQTTMEVLPDYAARSSSSGINAQQVFTKNGQSEITGFKLGNPKNFKAEHNQINVSSDKDEIYDISFLSTVPFTVDIEPKVDYVSIINKRSDFPAEATLIKVKVTKNTTGQARKDVKIIFKSTSTPLLYDEVLIKQAVQCPPFTATISNGLNGQTICEGSSLRLNASVLNGNTQDYSFKWSNGSTGSFLDTKNISAGANSYMVTATSNNSACQTQDEETIVVTAQPKPAKPVAVSAELSACSDQAIPSLRVQPQSGVSINWYNSVGNGLNSNSFVYTPPVRPAGEYLYYAEARSSAGCVNEERTAIKLTIHPKLTLATQIVEQNVSCKGGRDGVLNIKVNESFPTGITYQWSDQREGARRTGTRAGRYTVTATYGSGCVQVFNAEITEPDSIRIAIKSIKADTSNKGVGRIDVEVTGGTPPYNFTWVKDGSIFDNTQNIAELGAGSYQLEVIDKNKCSRKSAEVLIKQVVQCPPFTATISNGLNGQTICEGSSLRLNASVLNGSTQEYSFKWSNGSTGSFLDIKNIQAGANSYTVTATSNNSACQTQDEETIVVTAQPKPAKPVAVSAELSACSDQAMPSLRIQSQSGVSINWYNNEGDPLSSNTFIYTPSARPAGDYLYYAEARSNTGCVNEERTAIKLTIHPKLTLATQIVEQNVSCKGGRDGILNIKVNESFPTGIIYQWSDQREGARRTGTRAGRYTVTATYGSGCVQVFNAEITEPDSIRIAIKSIKPDTSNKGVGRIDVEVTGGTSPYNFTWVKDGSIFDNSQNIAELTPGNYILEVSDQNRCTRTSTPIRIDNARLTSTQDHPWSSLIQAFPNPTNGLINIAFDLPETVNVNAEIVNILGETILKFSPQKIAQGTLQTNLANYGSGIYLIKISVLDGQIFKKILLTR